uniref:Secreted protein n=1 Tax=Strombidium rassoulzadegani TaxID=1082188 RepID=A0A7S3CQL5_9SPIT
MSVRAEGVLGLLLLRLLLFLVGSPGQPEEGHRAQVGEEQQAGERVSEDLGVVVGVEVVVDAVEQEGGEGAAERSEEQVGVDGEALVGVLGRILQHGDGGGGPALGDEVVKRQHRYRHVEVVRGKEGQGDEGAREQPTVHGDVRLGLVVGLRQLVAHDPARDRRGEAEDGGDEGVQDAEVVLVLGVDLLEEHGLVVADGVPPEEAQSACQQDVAADGVGEHLLALTDEDGRGALVVLLEGLRLGILVVGVLRLGLEGLGAVRVLAGAGLETGGSRPHVALDLHGGVHGLGVGDPLLLLELVPATLAIILILDLLGVGGLPHEEDGDEAESHAYPTRDHEVVPPPEPANEEDGKARGGLASVDARLQDRVGGGPPRGGEVVSDQGVGQRVEEGLEDAQQHSEAHHPPVRVDGPGQEGGRAPQDGRDAQGYCPVLGVVSEGAREEPEERVWHEEHST